MHLPFEQTLDAVWMGPRKFLVKCLHFSCFVESLLWRHEERRHFFDRRLCSQAREILYRRGKGWAFKCCFSTNSDYSRTIRSWPSESWSCWYASSWSKWSMAKVDERHVMSSMKSRKPRLLACMEKRSSHPGWSSTRWSWTCLRGSFDFRSQYFLHFVEIKFEVEIFAWCHRPLSRQHQGPKHMDARVLCTCISFVFFERRGIFVNIPIIL